MATDRGRDNRSFFIRSLRTGSTVTKNCQSRFGIQDHVGNLSEWTRDWFYAAGSNFKYRQHSSGNDHPFYNLLEDSEYSSTPFTDPKFFGMITTEKSDINIDRRNFVIDSVDEFYAGKINIPLGLPIGNKVLESVHTTNPSMEKFVDFIFDINSTRGLTSEQLHDDRFYFWDDDDGNSGNGFDIPGTDYNGIVTGGSFRDGGDAGVYYLQLENSGQ